MATKIYTSQFRSMLPALFKAKSYFTQSFGSLEVLDGIRNNDKAFSLKTSDMDVVLNDYDKTKKINEGRLGEMKEVVSVNVDVTYDATKSINEGLDIETINDDLDQVAAERMEKQAQAIALSVDKNIGAKIAAAAGKTITGELTEKGVTDAFNDARKTFKNNEVAEDVILRAFVTSDVYNLLVDSGLAKTDKNSSVDIDNGTIYKFKGFVLVETPDSRFATTDNAYFVADGVGKPFLGFNRYRALDDVADFFGVALQSIVKYGAYVPDANKKAIVKARLAEVAAGEGA